jgi:DNA-binding NarL/FixJ family response regulator
MVTGHRSAPVPESEGTGQEIRVLLVDDHLSFRQPLAFMLMREPDITITGQAGTVAEARSLLSEADIALIDLVLPGGEGIELIRDLQAVNPQATALVLTEYDTTVAVARAVEAGASGVLRKTRPVSEITDAIRRVHAGEALVSVRETIELLRLITRQREEDRAVRATSDRLTPREREVLQTLAAGLSDREIAHQLHVSIETVRTHMVNLLHKLEVGSRLEAVVFAVKHGLVTIHRRCCPKTGDILTTPYCAVGSTGPHLSSRRGPGSCHLSVARMVDDPGAVAAARGNCCTQRVLQGAAFERRIDAGMRGRAGAPVGHPMAGPGCGQAKRAPAPKFPPQHAPSAAHTAPVGRQQLVGWFGGALALPRQGDMAVLDLAYSQRTMMLARI